MWLAAGRNLAHLGSEAFLLNFLSGLNFFKNNFQVKIEKFSKVKTLFKKFTKKLLRKLLTGSVSFLRFGREISL